MKKFKPGDLIQVFDKSELANRDPYPFIHPYNKQKGIVIRALVVNDHKNVSSFDALMGTISGEWLVECLIDGELTSIEPEYLIKIEQ